MDKARCCDEVEAEDEDDDDDDEDDVLLLEPLDAPTVTNEDGTVGATSVTGALFVELLLLFNLRREFTFGFFKKINLKIFSLYAKSS